MSIASQAGLAFGFALAVAIAATPLARALAVHFSILDHPRVDRPYKVHSRPVPYLGGLAVVAGVSGSLLATGLWDEIWAVVAGMVVLAAIGLIDDIREVSVSARLASELFAAGAVAEAGLRASVTGNEAVDLGLTILWIVGVTNALNIVDNWNGLSGGIVVISSTAFVALAFVEHQATLVAMAAAVAGATLGFLPYNFPRGRIFLGDAGTLPLGFLLSVLGLGVQDTGPGPSSLAVPACVLGLLIVNTLVVVTTRVRSGSPLTTGGADSLWHRLVQRGLSRSNALSLLLVTSSGMALVGVLVGYGVLPFSFVPAVLLLSAIAALAFVRAPESRGRLRHHPTARASEVAGGG